MLQVPIEIIILDKGNSEDVKNAIGLLHQIQNTFKYSILTNIDFEHKLNSENIVDNIDAFDFLDKYKSIIKGYHPHLICIISRYLNGKKLTNLFATLERTKGQLTGNGVITSYQVQGLIRGIPKSVYFMFYLLINPLRFIIKERIGHREPRTCIYDTKIDKADILKILKYGAFCLECNDKIRSVLSVNEMKSVREVIGFISDVANSNNPDQFFMDALKNYKVPLIEEDKSSKNHEEFEEATKLLKESKIEDAFDVISLLIKRRYPDYYDQAIMLFTRLNKLKLEKRQGVISREAESLESNKINLSLLELINELKKKND